MGEGGELKWSPIYVKSKSNKAMYHIMDMMVMVSPRTKGSNKSQFLF
mgnify:CR=1 FL=1